MSPIVTVIVPNYNHEIFLQQRLESIFNQTFQDFEVIIFDDASTDKSLEVLEFYKNNHKVSHFIVNQENSGTPFRQWKTGLELAKGKYIWIAETDDFAESNFLEKSVAVIENVENIVFTYTDSKIVDENGNLIGLFSTRKNEFFKTNKWNSSHFNDGIDEVLDFLLFKVTINNVSAVLFNKHHFQSIDFFKLSSFKNAGDLFVYISLCFKGSLFYIHEPLNNYRDHTKNATKINVKNGIIYYERLKCFNMVIDFIQREKLIESELNRLREVLNVFMNKNIFNLLRFKYHRELTQFLFKCKRSGIITFFEYIYSLFAIQLYQIKIYGCNSISTKILRTIFTK